ncbi:MAG TPA: polysaccharide deacetylase family protein [Acidimicrobiales bacterium]|nr:polysaccharide deacetylase family protein [Acidimicrobiales bacterium]
MAEGRNGTDGGGPVLSAVVFGYRNQATILRAVRSLLEQESDDPFEVIVATSGGDRTAELVRGAYPEVKVIESPTRLLPGGVRNLGSGVATGEYVGFLEADCVARPGWISRRIALHRQGHEAVASALDAMAGDGRIARAALYLVHPARLAGHPAGPADEYQAYGLSFTRELLERAGPFDETLRSYEDTAMAERLDHLGVRPWFDPGVCIEHDGPDSLGELLRDQYVRGGRDSWAELLRLPSGRHRHRLEVAPGSRYVVVFLRALYRLVKRIRTTATSLRQGHTGPAHELPGLFAPMALSQIAYQWGWARDQLLGTERGDGGRSRDELPDPTGFRRWVTTEGARVLSLTFDGLPGGAERHAILSALAATGAPATFFVAGAEAEARPADLQTVAAAGHLVGSSGWSGEPFPAMGADDLRHALERSGGLLKDLSGRPLRHVRPPGGDYDASVVATVVALGMEPWLWTDHPDVASPGAGAAALVRRTMDRLTPGTVVALPLGDPVADAEVAAALPELVDEARRRGYTFVPLTYRPSHLSATADADIAGT